MSLAFLSFAAAVAGAAPQRSGAEISNGRFQVTVNDFGVLTAAPAEGLDLGEGRGALLSGGFAEWFSVLYRTASGVHEHVGVGSARDWAGRSEVTRVSFGASSTSAVAVTSTDEFLIRTLVCFEEIGDTVVVFTDLTNRTAAPIRDILFAREWRPATGAGWSYPEDLPGRQMPDDLCRVIRMTDDLNPGATVCITHYYRLHGGDGLAADDVPLVLFTNADWPNGLTIGATNGVSIGDFNGDGWFDFFACQSAELWRNFDGQTWKLRKKLTNLLPPSILRYGSSFGDYDNDGLPDIGTEPRSDPGDPFMHLLHNLGNADFEDVAGDPNIVDVQPEGDSETLCWIDVDFDGDLDAFLPVYPPWAFSGNGNYFLHNRGPTAAGGEYRFEEESQAAGLDNPPPDSGRPEGAEFCDFDFDGDPDHYSCSTVFQNVSSFDMPRFRFMSEVASGVDFHEFYDEGAAFFDYDLDGDFDLVVAYCVGGHGVRIWESEGDGTFRKTAKSLIDSPNTGLCLGFSLCDWDLDGDIDFTTKEVFRRNMFVETGERHFTVATHSIPGSHLTSATPAWGDWDKDGDQDCVLGNWLDIGHFYDNYLYDASTAAEVKRHVRVKALRDSDLVPDGLETEYGAAVEIRVLGEEETRKRKQLVSSAGGYLNQNEYTKHFALPADPFPDDPAQDVHFDVVVDFPSDPLVGITRVDRNVNPELGDLDLATLTDREIHVFRSGKVVIDGCTFAPVIGADTVMTTSTGGLALPTDTTTLADPVTAPSSEWFVGVDFEVDPTAAPQLVKEVIVDGALSGIALNCGGADFKVALWDVSNAGNPVLLDTLNQNRRLRNHRMYIESESLLKPGHHYRLVASVESLRGSPVSAPVVSGAITVNGGLSFQDSVPCSGTGVAAAIVDPTLVYAAIRVVDDPGDLWAEHGYALAGASGAPVLTGSGELTPGSSVHLALTNSLPNTPTILVLGPEPLCLPLLGGTLFPQPMVLLGVPTDASGAFTLSANWPAAVDPGSSLYFQVWYADSSAVQGMAASNAVSATTRF